MPGGVTPSTGLATTPAPPAGNGPKKRGTPGVVPPATPTATPTTTVPDATIAGAGATRAIPVLFVCAMIAALLVATRRAWPRLRSHRLLTRIRPPKIRGAASGTA